MAIDGDAATSRPPRLGGRPVLLISECQRALIEVGTAMVPQLADQVAGGGILPRIAALATAFRAAGLPVVHCAVGLEPRARGFPVASPLQAMMSRNAHLRADHPLCAIHPEVAPEADDLACWRTHGITAFHDTGLEAMLRGLGADTVVLAGVSTDLAIPGMAIEAVNRGFQVVVAADCTAGVTAAGHRHSIDLVLPALGSVCRADAIERALARLHAKTSGGRVGG